MKMRKAEVKPNAGIEIVSDRTPKRLITVVS